MKLRQLVKKGIVTTLVAAMLLSGCGSAETAAEPEQEVTESTSDETAEEVAEESTDADSEQQASAEEESTEEAKADTDKSELADALKKKYSASEKTEYNGEVIKVNRDESIQIELGYNPWGDDITLSPSESFVVYQDAELQYPVDIFTYDYDADNGMLTVGPPYYGVGEMDSSEIDLSHLSGNYLMEDDSDGWGTLGQYYLAAYVDAQTGEELEKPVVTVIKVQAELSTPQMTFDPTDDGYACFTWKEVEGADGYLLFRIDKDEEGLWDYTYVYADVTDTEWSSQEEDVESDYSDEVLSLNYRFQQFFFDDDLEAYLTEEASELLEFVDLDEEYGQYSSEYYGMIAYNSEGCSAMSNLISAADLAKMLPTEKASYANEEALYEISGTLDLPAVMSVTMCDGSTAQKVIDYDFDNIEKMEEDGYFIIQAKICQTPFTEEIHAYDVNWDTFDEDIEAVKVRQEELKNKGGNVAPSLTVDEGSEAEPKTEDSDKEETKTEEKEDTEVKEETDEKEESKAEEKEEADDSELVDIEVGVTANSAMSEYVAINMLETEEVIDLSAFPESADTEKIVDAFFEAQYQNPLILGIQGGSIDPENRLLYVEYDFGKAETEERQEAIKARVEEIASEIFTDDMSDLEKETAINEWLCENAYYDDDALENAEKYSFTKVDEDFYDSFTAYGVLVDGVGVCASYSAGFKLLADAAGLESIVVTGYLDGSVPHAWNKVNVDGTWYIVDSTNNDNDTIDNALFNLSDSAAGSTLVENDSFVLNGTESGYAAGEDELEYYHTTDRYFDTDV
ncbi:MAG: hypothetical protein IJ409_07930, partial [Lachnospiraceae bacterium]|nr:hypothetical protein [Lachnospiraceae bacterium]